MIDSIWQAALLQAKITGLAGVIVSGLFLALGLIPVILILRYRTKWNMDTNDICSLCAISIIILCVSGVILTCTLSVFLNPEWAAMTYIRGF